MNTLLVLANGAIVGVLTGSSIFFAREEPYQLETFLAITVRSLLVSLLTGFSLGPSGVWWQGLGFGGLYGLATALVVFLAEGGFKKGKDSPYLLLGGLITGTIIGLLDALFAIRR